MIKQLFILLLVLSSCSGKQTENVSTDSAIDERQEPSIRVETDTLSETRKLNDTIFIKREVTKDFYHAIYIDPARESKYYDWLTDFEFDKYDLQAYAGNYKYVKEKNPEAFKKVNTPEISKNWIPVYSYKNNYYLYAPSDWGNAGRRIINDSAFVYWYMDGPLPVPLTSAKKVGHGKVILEMMELFNEKPSSEKLTIHQIDSKTGLSVFEFTNESEMYKYRLYVPIENAKQFDMIVNHCDNQKQREFKFDPIDFEELIKKAANKTYKQ